MQSSTVTATLKLKAEGNGTRPQNLVMDSTVSSLLCLPCRWGPEAVKLKVIDYGLATFCEPGQEMYSMIGTARYVAPEVSLWG